MRILHVNKFLYRRGGAEGYMLDVAQLQRADGHEVAFFAMAHPQNEPSRYERSFPAYVEFEPPPAGVAAKIRGTARLMWSASARRGMQDVVRDFRPDVVHLHNVYHQLSPSVLQPVRRGGVAAVMTLHDYKLACPTYRFLDHGRICEACLPRRFWEPVVRRCNAGSLGASAVNAVEMSLHTIGGAYAPVGVFSCPSRFLMEKMRQGKVFPERLRHLPNFVSARTIEAKGSPGGGVVYAGRLSDEKGVDVLIEAVGATPGLTLDVAGDGPARPNLEARAEALGASDRVTFHGRLDPESLRDLLRASAVAVVPSRWYENMPLAVLEAFAVGVPVVGTALGGIPELIEPGVDGDLVPPNDAEALARSLSTLVGHPNRAFEMGRAAREKAERAHDPGAHIERLTALYDEARRHGRSERAR